MRMGLARQTRASEGLPCIIDDSEPQAAAQNRNVAPTCNMRAVEMVLVIMPNPL